MKLTILFLSLSLAINCSSQTISGKVLDTDTEKPLANSAVFLVTPETTEDSIDICYFSIYKYKVLSETKTDSLGNYSFTGLTPKVYNIIADFSMPEIKDFGFHGSRQEIDSNVNIKAETNYYKVLHLMVTCPFDKTKNYSSCPICKKRDKVVPIIYGLPRFDNNGIVAGLKAGKYVLGGCVVDAYCNASKTCLRCHKEF